MKNTLKIVGSIPDKILIKKENYYSNYNYYIVGNPNNPQWGDWEKNKKIVALDNDSFQIEMEITNFSRNGGAWCNIYATNDTSNVFNIELTHAVFSDLLKENICEYGKFKLPVQWVISGMLKPVTIGSETHKSILESMSVKNISLKEIKKNYLYKDKRGVEHYVFDIGYTVVSKNRNDFLKDKPKLEKRYLTGRFESYLKTYNYYLNNPKLIEEVRPLTSKEIKAYNNYKTEYTNGLKSAIDWLSKSPALDLKYGWSDTYGPYCNFNYCAHEILSIYGLQQDRENFINKWLATLALT